MCHLVKFYNKCYYYKITNPHKQRLIYEYMDKNNMYNVLEVPLSPEQNDWVKITNQKQKFTDNNITYKEKFYKKPRDTEYIYNEKNKKKILCNNILNFGKCNYNGKCLYAHNCEEQNVDPQRKELYDNIKSDGEWNIDLSKNDNIAKQLMVFTKVCQDCIKNKCPGGYNCKYGVMDKKYQICYKDIYYGTCDNKDCKLLHLTKRGVLPSHPIKKQPEQNTEIEGNLLTSAFFLINKPQEPNDSESDSDLDSSIEQIQEYLNKNEDIDLCEKSIFISKS